MQWHIAYYRKSSGSQWSYVFITHWLGREEEKELKKTIVANETP